MKKKNEFSIMPENLPYWTNVRYPGLERHEIFEGRTSNRDKSIEDGLVIFTTPEFHRTGKFSIHGSHTEWENKTHMQDIAKHVWCEYYNKTEEDFLVRYRNRFF